MIDVESDDQPYFFIANPLYDGAFADCWCRCLNLDYCLDVFCTTADDYPFFDAYRFATNDI